MAYIHFITGGQRSGKSRYAQALALQASNTPIYLATAKVWDEEFKGRIQRHQGDRDDRWTSIEEQKFVSSHNFIGKSVVMDCVTLWLTNYFIDLKNDIDLCLAQSKEEFEKLAKQDFTLFIISNEIGMGIHAETAIGRKFTDLQGWMNQYIAEKANEVTLMVSGLPLRIK